MTDIRRNNNSEFVGIEKLKSKHYIQLEKFEMWAYNEQWNRFHVKHYDWWMFPYDHPSSYKYAYTIYEYEVNILKSDPKFMDNYIRGVELLMLSWGWNLNEESYVENPKKNQVWANWPIRLYKCGMSLKLFEKNKEYGSIIKYATDLRMRGESFIYNDKELYNDLISK